MARAYVSVRDDQKDDPARARYPRIVDRGDIEGPIAGISAAFASSADVAWLVIACDLPFLDAQTLDTLLLARDPGFDATAFRSSHDGLPEPLCAIYEPSARKGIAAQIAAGRNCPRKFLINAHTQLLEQPNPRALDARLEPLLHRRHVRFVALPVLQPSLAPPYPARSGSSEAYRSSFPRSCCSADPSRTASAAAASFDPGHRSSSRHPRSRAASRPTTDTLIAARAAQGLRRLPSPRASRCSARPFREQRRGRAVGTLVSSTAIAGRDRSLPRRRLARPDDLLARGLLHQPPRRGGRHLDRASQGWRRRATAPPVSSTSPVALATLGFGALVYGLIEGADGRLGPPARCRERSPAASHSWPPSSSSSFGRITRWSRCASSET